MKNLWIMSPFEAPDVTLAVGTAKAGAFPILHLGRDHAAAEAALGELSRQVDAFGVCLADEHLAEIAFPEQVSKIVLPHGMLPPEGAKAEIVRQVHSVEEAQAALADGAKALILKGGEGAGFCGEDSGFILFQRLIASCRTAGASVVIQGGVGVHTAAAYLALGAEAVIMDAQVALLPECGIASEIKAVIGRLSGNEIRVHKGYRYFLPPGLQNIDEDASLDALLSRVGTTTKHYLPLGQDVILAADYAERYRNLKGLVRAAHRAASSHPERAKAQDALAENGDMAESLGTRYPIAQGPMARVSDVPEFLSDVADGGALPFLAMSVLSGEAAETALMTTAEIMKGKTWGAGILGFAYPSLVEEQSRLILKARPSAVLIAGGRPSQAKVFEEQGIDVFLHAPTQGLLEMFLKEGQRGFVFEGRESGGHVGPLFSSVLWEKQINCLLKRDSADSLRIFFAGGIHDALSAAFVRVMAAALTARDAKIGLFVGTAYLYTEEIVTRGAITEDYRRLLLENDRTILLKSGDGQETRAVPSPFTAFFLEERKRMKEAGLETAELLLELEKLNIGRLRIAAKGIERRGEETVHLPRDEQLENGLYMTGAITAFVRETTTIAALHDKLVAGSRALLEEMPPPEEEHSGREAVDIAVVGMAGMFPEAENLDEYWKNILFGKDCIREVPDERWSKDVFYDPEAKDVDHVPSKWGGFLGAADFDALEFGITPQSLAAIEPVQLLSLLVTKRALEDAGYTDLS
ncbi:MAG: nitronate monooxygenase, partial [Azoarcus sp.]|nr:nitronate monooxygenase [Azoarcus sp.]